MQSFNEFYSKMKADNINEVGMSNWQFNIQQIASEIEKFLSKFGNSPDQSESLAPILSQFKQTLKIIYAHRDDSQMPNDFSSLPQPKSLRNRFR